MDRDERDDGPLDLMDAIMRLPATRGEGPAHPELVGMFRSDQEDRADADEPVGDLDARDRRRRARVLALPASGHVMTAADALHAARMLQHGDRAEHYRPGFEPARRAAQAGHRGARRLSAAAMDRGLLSVGLPQRFGTQSLHRAGRWTMPRIDPAITDADRADGDLPPLAELIARLPAQT